jgi:hypothetical protein
MILYGLASGYAQNILQKTKSPSPKCDEGDLLIVILLRAAHILIQDIRLQPIRQILPLKKIHWRSHRIPASLRLWWSGDHFHSKQQSGHRDRLATSPYQQ